MAQKYIKANFNAKSLRVNTEEWTLDELAAGKQYEPPAEVEIKVATTEHPPVPFQRPPCPGVEGIGPGCYASPRKSTLLD